MAKMGAHRQARRFDPLSGGSAEAMPPGNAALLRAMAEHAPVGIVLYQDGRVRYANAAFEALTGYSRDELLAMSFWDLIHPDFRELVRKQALAHLRDEQPSVHYEIKLLTKDGTERWVDATGTAIELAGKPAALGTAFDITERKRAEEALARGAAAYAAIAEVSEALIESRPIDDISHLVLEYAKSLTGSAIGFVGYIDPQTGYLICPTHTRDAWDACQVANKTVVYKEFKGLWGWVLVNRKPLLTNAPADDPRSTGTPSGHLPIERFLSVPALLGATLVGQIALANSDRDYDQRDLELIERLATLYALAIQRQRSEETLRRTEEEFRLVFENAKDAIFWADPETGVILRCNKAAEALLERTRNEIVGKHQTVLHPPGKAVYYADMFAKHLEQSGVLDDEAEVITKSSKIKPVHIASSVTSVGGKPIIQGIFRDITERKRAEEALQEAREQLEGRVERQLATGGKYGLTFRELTVLHLVADGKSDKEIAATLGISPLTAQKHVANILCKMKASSRTEAGVRAVREGIVV